MEFNSTLTELNSTWQVIHTPGRFAQALFFLFKISLTFASVLLNCIVIKIILRLNHRKRSFSNYLFLSSAIADLFIGMIPMPLMITYRIFYNSLTGKNSTNKCQIKAITGSSGLGTLPFQYLNISLTL